MDCRVIERGNIMYKLIAFDCDGTLLNDQKQIDKDTINAIKKVKNKGIKIVLATSKSFYRIKNYLNELDLLEKEQYTVSFNGGYVLNNTEVEVLHKELLSLEAVNKIIAFGKQFDLYTFIYEKDRIMSNKPNDSYVKYNPDVPFIVVDFDKLDLTNVSIYKIIIHGPSKEEVSKAKSMLGNEYNNMCEVTSSNVNNIEFIPFGNSKTTGLRVIGQKLNIKADEMIAFGDNENDLDMFNYVGYKVAMGNGIEELKQISSLVTLSNNENGIARALEEMINKGII